MNKLLNKYSQLTVARVAYTSALSLLLVSLGGCGGTGYDNGVVTNYIETPTGPINTLYCPEVGVNDEPCIIFDPENPYQSISVNGTSKWVLDADINGSESTLVSRSRMNFYLWATALAAEPSGENQFYTANALQQNYALEGSLSARNQAKKAYRSFLDNFLDSITYDETGTVEIPLINWVTPNLVNPGATGFLYDNQAEAFADLDSWGYEYNPSANPPTISKKPI